MNTFAPPSNKDPQKSSSGMPVFTPPGAPITFEPPKRPQRTHYGPVCYYHQDEDSVAQCVRCGKYICKDCYDSYSVSGGEYAGQALCYDCAKQLVAENVEILKKQKTKIMTTFILTLIGMFIGALFFSESFAAGLICMLWFGSFWSWVKGTFAGWANNPFGKSVGGLIGSALGSLIVAPFNTIKKLIQCIVYLKKTSGFIEGDSEALRQMTDYMEYTQIRNQYGDDVDIDTLLSMNSQLADNSVAQMAKTQSEEQIEAQMRNCLATINENGEIIRNFAA